MILQWLIAVTFWLSYLAITFAAVITITDFVLRVTPKKPGVSPSQVEQESVKLHISEGLIQVNRLPEEQGESREG